MEIKEKIFLSKKSLTIGVNSQLKLADAKLIAENAIPVSMSPGSYAAMESSHQFLKECVEQRIPIYGVNTQFGDQVTSLDAHLNNLDSVS